MSESPRALFERWLEAVNRQDHAALRTMLHPDYVDEMPQSGERTVGVENLIAMLEKYPNLDQMAMENTQLIGADDRWIMTPNFRVVQVEGDADVFTATAAVRYPDESYWHMIVIARLKDGLIHRTTSFYAPDFDAPEWRAPWVERMEDHRISGA
jgi:SnoaL-like domain